MVEITLHRAMGYPMPTLIELLPEHDASGAVRPSSGETVRPYRYDRSRTGRTGNAIYRVGDGVYEAVTHKGSKYVIVRGDKEIDATYEEALAAL